MFRDEQTQDDRAKDLAEAFLLGKLGREEAAQFETVLASDERLRKALVAALSTQVLLEVGLGSSPAKPSSAACRESRAAQGAYESGTLEGAPLATLLDHLEACTECIGFYGRPKRGRPVRSSRARVAAAAALTLVLVAVGVLVLRLEPETSPTSARAPSDAAVLPGGSADECERLGIQRKTIQDGMRPTEEERFLDGLIAESKASGRKFLAELRNVENARGLVDLLDSLPAQDRAERAALLGLLVYNEELSEVTRTNALRSIARTLGADSHAWFANDILQSRSPAAAALWMKALVQAATSELVGTAKVTIDEKAIVQLGTESFPWADDETRAGILKILQLGHSEAGAAYAIRWGEDRIDRDLPEPMSLGASPITALQDLHRTSPNLVSRDDLNVLESWRHRGPAWMRMRAAEAWAHLDTQDVERRRFFLAMARQGTKTDLASMAMHLHRYAIPNEAPEIRQFLAEYRAQLPERSVERLEVKLKALTVDQAPAPLLPRPPAPLDQPY